MIRLAAVVWLGACSGGDPANECDSAASPTWSNFAQGHVQTWCTPCHTASLQGELARQGAPEDLDFDTYADVVEHSLSISVWATGDVPAMPPLGGVDPEDVDRFGLWLSCGAPGTPAPSDPCDTLVAGPAATVSSQAEADAVCSQGTNAVAGLTITTTAVLDCLCAVQGPLVARGGDVSLPRLGAVDGPATLTDGVTGFSAPRLAQVTGALTVEAASLVALDLRGLDRVDGDVVLQGAHGLQTLRFDGLQRVGALTVADLQGLQQLALPRLRQVHGSFVLSALPALTLLAETNAIVRIDGDLVLEGTALIDLDHWSFQFLEQLGGTIRIENNAELDSVAGFTLLTEAPGDVVVRGNPGLRGITGFDNVGRIAGDLVVANNTAQENITGFVNLTQVDGTLRLGGPGDLRTSNALIGLSALEHVGHLVVENSSLSGFDGLPALQQVVGDLVFDGNADLDDIDGFGALTSVGGLLLRNNLALEDLAGLSGVLGIDGDAAVVGNASLTTLMPLHQVGSVGGALTVTGNTTLPSAVVDDWIAAIGPENIVGPVTVENNGP